MAMFEGVYWCIILNMYFLLILGILAIALMVSFKARVNEINSQRESFINMMETDYGKEVTECFRWSYDIFFELFEGDCFDEMSKSQSMELIGYVKHYEELGKELKWNETAKDWSTYFGLALLIYGIAIFVNG